MPGTKEGSLKARETMLRKYGEDYFARIGAKGGKNGHTGGFYANRELARRAGAIGGTKSSRLGVPNSTKRVVRAKQADYIPKPPKKKFLFWSY